MLEELTKYEYLKIEDAVSPHGGDRSLLLYPVHPPLRSIIRRASTVPKLTLEKLNKIYEYLKLVYAVTPHEDDVSL